MKSQAHEQKQLCDLRKTERRLTASQAWPSH